MKNPEVLKICRVWHSGPDLSGCPLEAEGEAVSIAGRGPLRTDAYAIDNGARVFTVLLRKSLVEHPGHLYEQIDIKPGRLEPAPDGLYYVDHAVLL